MILKKRKVVLIGCGLVGISYAYSLLITGDADEIAMIDTDRKRLAGEIDDLCHGLPFAAKNTEIYKGSYLDCKNADIVVITAGVAQKPGEGRIGLLKRNREIFADIIPHIMSSGFSGIMIVATNPVDLMTSFARELSGLPYTKVIGSGTTVDTGRLKYLLGSYYNLDPKSVHAYVIGEHGDSEFVPWSSANIATKSIDDICKENIKYSMEDMYSIEDRVRKSGASIIEFKGATCYGIGMALNNLTRTILSDEKTILTPSCMLMGEYGRSGVYIGVPAIIGSEGVSEIIELKLTDSERHKFSESCDFLIDINRAASVH